MCLQVPDLTWGTNKAVTDEVHVSGDFDSICPDKARNENSQAVKEVKQRLLVEIIEKFKMNQCLVFCRTNLDCSNMELYLNKFSCESSGKGSGSGGSSSGKKGLFSCCVLAGKLSQEQRRTNLKRFKDGEVRIMLCTDVAARGIDINSLPFVVNMTLPDEAEDYIHRVGRVGRADKMGLAITIVGEEEKVWYHTCGGKGSCTNRRLKSADGRGGCTTWLDEPDMLESVEARLHQKVHYLLPTT